jgi:RNA recognition motif-containing protein
MNIYVGNLSFDAKESDLRDAFQAFGAVDTVKVIEDGFSGRSRGFAFVEMPDKSEAESAISALNGKSLQGRDIKVNEAKPRSDRGSGGGGRRY